MLLFAFSSSCLVFVHARVAQWVPGRLLGAWLVSWLCSMACNITWLCIASTRFSHSCTAQGARMQDTAARLQPMTGHGRNRA